MTPYEKRGMQYYQDDKMIGHLERTIQKTVYISPRVTWKHYFRKHEGWAIGLDLLKHLIADEGVTEIQLIIDGKIKATASADTWMKLGVYIHYPGYEEQRVLPYDRFNKVGK